jgi:AraC-like DNA-binding protein
VTGCPEIEQQLNPMRLHRHRHDVAYATIVLEGGYIERGSTGCWIVEAGHVVCHRMFDSHNNQVLHQNTRVLNIPIQPNRSLPSVFTVADPDALVRAVRIGSPDVKSLLCPAHVLQSNKADWPDVLAAALSNAPLSLSDWAENAGFASAAVSRGFLAAYGVSPSRFRLEAQAIRALSSLITNSDSLTEVALDCGFSDQAHLSRTLKNMTGRTPGQWRRIKSIQDGATQVR